MQITDKPTDIPTSPGVYRWRDASDRVIYVGKAKNLKNRINSYFTNDLHPRTQTMVSAARSLDWVTVRTETEALQLEYAWIKEFDPNFNVRYRDDKSYPFLAVTLDEEWPRAVVMRGVRKKGTRYFGPYPHAWAIRDTLDLLLRTFPVRTCSQSKFNTHNKFLKHQRVQEHVEGIDDWTEKNEATQYFEDNAKTIAQYLDGVSKGLTVSAFKRITIG